MKKWLLFIVLPLICIGGLSAVIGQNVAKKDAPRHLRYIFLGHTYQWGAKIFRVDQRIEEMDRTQFDRIWLGGDILPEASLHKDRLMYLDTLFDLSKPGNHWALGNHDIRPGNLEWIEELTGRPTFYSHYQEGIVSVVLDLSIPPTDCERIDAQYEMVKNICDTISSSSHLIFLMHHGIWYDVPGLPQSIGRYAHSKLTVWQANCFMKDATFAAVMYPMLIEVHKRGIMVLNILGDAGDGSKEFYKESDDGIHFFSSGINNSKYRKDPEKLAKQKKDKVLIFEHYPEERKLTWKFHELNDLVDN